MSGSARLCIGAWLWAICAAASAAPGSVLDLDRGTITYTVVHKLHEVKGTTHAIEGRAQVLPDGELRVQVRAAIASFDSGNSNRDEHMLEATHGVEHPVAEVKGTAAQVLLPLAQPRDLQLDATVELNGIQRQQRLGVRLTQEGAAVRARFSVPISLEAFHVERPELLLVKVDDEVRIDGDLLFERRTRQ